jgi:transcriptional regulator with XRE-family HTH domain
MDSSTPIGKILCSLKEQLKAKGLRYRDVAARLKVSEATVKRYFNGQGLSVTRLQSLAAMVGLDLLSLALTANGQGVRRGLNKAQLAALSRRGPARTVFFMLGVGWTPAQVAREFDLGDQMDSILALLESWGLIRRLAGGAVKVLVAPEMDGHAYGQMSDSAIESAEEFLRTLNPRTLDLEWICLPMRLSADAVTELQQMIKRFHLELHTFTRRELTPARRDDKWFRVFVAAQTIPRKHILRRPESRTACSGNR